MRIQHVPPQIDLQVRQAGIGDGRIQRLDEIGRDDVHRIHRRNTDRGQVLLPFEIGREQRQLAHGHLVIGVGGIAPRHAIHGGFGQGRLELHDHAGCCLKIRAGALGLRQQREQGANVLFVLFAQLDGSRVGLQIVVAVRKAEAALIHLGDLLVGLLIVLPNVEIEERAHAGHVQPDHLGRQFALGSERVDLLQQRLDGLNALSLDSRFIHAGGVEFPDLRVPSLFQDAAFDRQIAVRQFVEARPAGLIGRNGIVLAPCPAGVLIEVLAWIDGGIHGLQVDSGCGGFVGGK